MKILVLSNTPWADSNSFGNSFSNIFCGIAGLEFANIFCRYGAPDNQLVEQYYQITERSLLSNLRDSSRPSGRAFVGTTSASSDSIGLRRYSERIEEPDELSIAERAQFDFLRSRRWQVFFWARDLIWKIGRWDTPDLRRFIKDFAPDLIFQPIYYSSYLNDIAVFISRYADVPVVGYVSDDVYTLKQFSLSPFYWIDRIFKRRKVKRIINLCEFLYVISDIQKREYEVCFGKRCEILTKCADFQERPNAESTTVPGGSSRPIQLVYTGNIGVGRWKSLALVAQALEAVNSASIQAQLRIYTTTPIKNAMKRALNLGQSSAIRGQASVEGVIEIQREADILVHAEGFDLASRLHVHQSFSTKIVDYLAAGRCIFAVGPIDVASVDYFVRNDCAVVASSKAEIGNMLSMLVGNPALIPEYGKRAWDCGKRNHSRRDIQGRLRADLRRASMQRRLQQ
jgi:hypothetical protein